MMDIELIGTQTAGFSWDYSWQNGKEVQQRGEETASTAKLSLDLGVIASWLEKLWAKYLNLNYFISKMQMITVSTSWVLAGI